MDCIMKYKDFNKSEMEKRLKDLFNKFCSLNNIMDDNYYYYFQLGNFTINI